MASSAIDLGPDLRMSRADYRRWAAAQPRGRFERIDGPVVAVAPERLSHCRLQGFGVAGAAAGCGGGWPLLPCLPRRGDGGDR
jgi:hypothetical protein